MENAEDLNKCVRHVHRAGTIRALTVDTIDDATALRRALGQHRAMKFLVGDLDAIVYLLGRIKKRAEEFENYTGEPLASAA